MYAKSKMYATYFKSDVEQKEKVFYGRVSESIKVSKPEAEKAEYEFETWNARFVGKALEKAKALEDKAKISLTEWACRNPYDKEKGKSFPYILVLDFEVQEEKAEK